MKEEFKPKYFSPYKLTPGEQLELDKFLKENLEKGYIRPSQSPMASPMFFVAKKMESYDHVKIIDTSTNRQSKMPIPFL